MLLGDGPVRFNELKRRVAGISQRMLSLTLRNLERDGLVSRTVTPSVPVRVDYALTDLGRSLCRPGAPARRMGASEPCRHRRGTAALRPEDRAVMPASRASRGLVVRPG